MRRRRRPARRRRLAASVPCLPDRMGSARPGPVVRGGAAPRSRVAGRKYRRHHLSARSGRGGLRHHVLRRRHVLHDPGAGAVPAAHDRGGIGRRGRHRRGGGIADRGGRLGVVPGAAAVLARARGLRVRVRADGCGLRAGRARGHVRRGARRRRSRRRRSRALLSQQQPLGTRAGAAAAPRAARRRAHLRHLPGAVPLADTRPAACRGDLARAGVRRRRRAARARRRGARVPAPARADPSGIIAAVVLVELLVGLFAAAIAFAWLARHLGLPYPIALVLGGAAIGFVPGLPRLPFDPNLILVLVLPPILYQAALFTSWRDFRANLRSISLLAVGLVIATTVAVAVTLKWLVPELPWAVAFAFGAIVSPPDAVAATAIMSRMNVPRRIVTLVEGESLVNDASGLVFYRFAVAAALTGAFSLVEAAGEFVLIAGGGIAIGIALARLFVAIHRRVGDLLMELTLSVMLPYLAYLVAERLHVSGVLAVVAAGLVRGRYAPEAFSAQARIAAYSLWRVVVFAVNCLIFIMIGLQLPGLVAGLAGTSLAQAIGYGVLLSLVAIVVRLAWVFIGAFVLPIARTKLGWLAPCPPWQHVAVVGWCGMRGIVSLAAALALPLALVDGSPFPGRDLLVFLAFVVIFATLVVPGFTLAPLVRALRVGGDWSVHAEQTLARGATARAALAEIERLERERDITPEIAASLRSDFQARLVRARPTALAVAHGDDPWVHGRRAVVRAERRRLVALWREGRIGDEVLHEIEQELDFEESLLG